MLTTVSSGTERYQVCAECLPPVAYTQPFGCIIAHTRNIGNLFVAYLERFVPEPVVSRRRALPYAPARHAEYAHTTAFLCRASTPFQLQAALLLP